MKYIFALLLFMAACMQPEKQHAKILDGAVVELQLQAFQHREYYFKVLQYTTQDKPDSIAIYAAKMDSVLKLYTKSMRKYDSLTKILQQ